MLEHPEITWIERTGYPSWLQEGKCREEDREEGYDIKREEALMRRLERAAGG